LNADRESGERSSEFGVPIPSQFQNPKSKIQNSSFGFTLLEILVAVVLLATAFTIIWSTFATTVDGWRRSGDFLDRITHGDFVIDQMVSSLRSTAFFPNRPDKFGFWLESSGGGDGARDTISWVTSGTAFMLQDDPLAKGLHRIMIGVDDGLSVRSFQHLKEEIEKSDVEPWVVSPRVVGLDCRIYNFEDEDWDEEWEDTNAVPSLVEITVFMEPVEKGRPPIKLQRIVEIPVAPAVTGAVQVGRAPGPGGGAEPGIEGPGGGPGGAGGTNRPPNVRIPGQPPGRPPGDIPGIEGE
jgi:prepilin-type N-terminal cleavage/methylation domain-containing protein